MRTRLRLGMLAAVVAFAATGCINLIPPQGPAPLRYRDQIFGAVTTTSDIPFATADDQQGNPVTLHLDVYEPTGDTSPARPAVVWVHGGSFCCGSKTEIDIVDQANVFAQKGYVAFSIEYRVSQHGCTGGGGVGECGQAILDAQHDAQAAVRWVRAHAADYRIDTTRVAIAGTSAGAITALNVGYNSEDANAGGDPAYSDRVSAAVSLSGARLLGNFDANDAPALMFHGTADPLVPYAWAVATKQGADDNNLLAILDTWEGDGHVPYLKHRQQILDETQNFLYHSMNLSAADQTPAGS